MEIFGEEITINRDERDEEREVGLVKIRNFIYDTFAVSYSSAAQTQNIHA